MRWSNWYTTNHRACTQRASDESDTRRNSRTTLCRLHKWESKACRRQARCSLSSILYWRCCIHPISPTRQTNQLFNFSRRPKVHMHCFIRLHPVLRPIPPLLLEFHRHVLGQDFQRGGAHHYQRKLRIMLTVCVSLCVWDLAPEAPSNMIKRGKIQRGISEGASYTSLDEWWSSDYTAHLGTLQ